MVQEFEEASHAVCTTGLEAFRLLTIYLKPILPRTAAAVEEYLRVTPLNFVNADSLLGDCEIGEYKHLLKRVNRKDLQEVIDSSGSAEVTEKVPKQTARSMLLPEEFARVELRVARIIDCKEVAESERLLQLLVDVGEETPRTILTGLKGTCEASHLIGKTTVIVANLSPKATPFGLSQGMVLATLPNDMESGVPSMLEITGTHAPGSLVR